VLEIRKNLPLPAKASIQAGIHQLRMNQFDSDLDTVRPIYPLGAIHRAHAAAAEHLLQFVGSDSPRRRRLTPSTPGSLKESGLIPMLLHQLMDLPKNVGIHTFDRREVTATFLRRPVDHRME